jgi:hypothetical protein
MNPTLSFRRESIQQSSRESEALNRRHAEGPETKGSKHARSPWYPTLTTSLTTI